MIDNQAIETMSQMLSLIKEYAKSAYPDVETESSSENRRRAWVITNMLAKIAQCAAESDLQSLLADDVHRTYSERDGHVHNAKCSDREFMLELHEFKKRAEEYKTRPTTSEQRTDGDAIRELELLYPQRDALYARRSDAADRLKLNMSKKEEKLAAADLANVQTKLDSIEEKVGTAEALLVGRGITVSFNRYRTVVERVAPKRRSSRTKANEVRQND
jgi:hypothetical protein